MGYKNESEKKGKEKKIESYEMKVERMFLFGIQE